MCEKYYTLWTSLDLPGHETEVIVVIYGGLRQKVTVFGWYEPFLRCDCKSTP